MFPRSESIFLIQKREGGKAPCRVVGDGVAAVELDRVETMGTANLPIDLYVGACLIIR